MDRSRFIAILGTAVFLSLVGVCLGRYSGGTGEPNGPYRIATAADLNDIANHVEDYNKCFVMVNDVNLADYNNHDFNIIGSGAQPFRGIFDGNGHAISHFVYRAAEEEFYVGLFGVVDGPNAEVKDLLLVEPNMCAPFGYDIGTLVGYLAEGRLDMCRVIDANVEGYFSVGGLIGTNESAVSSCSFSGSVVAYELVGGLIGTNEGTVSTSYSTGEVSGTTSVGGLVGRHGPENMRSSSAELYNCYSGCAVSGSDYIGGLTGYNHRESLISNCYARGVILGTDHVGGLVGGNYMGRHYYHISASYWDVNTSGQMSSDGGGKGKTTDEMQMSSTFIGWGGCGNDGVWKIEDGHWYPRLWWEGAPGEALISELSDFVEGSGTQAEPYLIHTAEELNRIGLFSCEWDKHFSLAADVNLYGFSSTNLNTIGSHVTGFAGVFDGNGHTISNFNYATSTISDSAGIFGVVGSRLDSTAGVIKDVILSDPNISGQGAVDVGCLVGRLERGSITDCQVTGGSISWHHIVSGPRASVGGLVGFSSASITGCSTTGTISVSREDYVLVQVGGLVGRQDREGAILRCSSSGSVSGDNYVGGLIGLIVGDWGVRMMPISECWSAGSVTGGGNIGGLVGRNNGGLLSNCYSKSSVSGSAYQGGLVGYNDWGNAVNCYAAGHVSIGPETGGFVGGKDYATIFTNCFWDNEINPDVNGVGNENDPNVIGKTTAEMQMEVTFTDVGWDFVGEAVNGPNDIWDICEGTNYSRLVWGIPVWDFVCPDGVDGLDFAYFASRWGDENCGDVNDCDGVDFDFSGEVDWGDFKIFCDHWLEVEGIGL